MLFLSHTKKKPLPEQAGVEGEWLTPALQVGPQNKVCLNWVQFIPLGEVFSACLSDKIVKFPERQIEPVFARCLDLGPNQTLKLPVPLCLAVEVGSEGYDALGVSVHR